MTAFRGWQPYYALDVLRATIAEVCYKLNIYIYLHICIYRDIYRYI